MTRERTLLIAASSLQTADPVASAAGAGEPAARRRITDRPLDSALYSCRCGMVFDADVSANVCCPHCGGEQPW